MSLNREVKECFQQINNIYFRYIYIEKILKKNDNNSNRGK